MMKPTNPVVNRSHPLSRGLVGAWPMSDGGTTTARNIGEWGYPATVTNTISTISEHGRARLFAPTGSVYNDLFFPNVDPIRIRAGMAFTWLAWVRPDNVTGDKTILNRYGGGSQSVVSILVRDSQLFVQFVNNGRALDQDILLGASGSFEAGKWTLAGIMRDANNVIYGILDGILYTAFTDGGAADDGPGTWGGSPVDGYWHIGRAGINSGPPGSSPMYGQISDLRFYQCALSASELMETYVDPFSVYRPARPIRELYRGKAAGGGAISTGLSAIEAGAVYGAPGLNSGLHAISTGIAT